MTTGVLRFKEPDFSVGPEERALFSVSASKRVVDEEIVLNDARTSDRILKGAAGLDVQGFAYVHHRSALANSDKSTDSWFEGRNVEEVYLPEVCDLVCKITGAKKAIVNNSAFRRRLADKQQDPRFYHKAGGEFDKQMAELPSDVPLVGGKQEGFLLEPARPIHVDYTVAGLRRTVRECRHDIKEMASEILEAEDALARGERVSVPRYAAYSVWRSVKTVKRDPIAVADYRTVDPSELARDEYRCKSNQTANGEYLMEFWAMLAPKDPNRTQYYWMPEQQPDEVLIIKFADTAAEEDSNIAAYCPHGSPKIPGTENEEPRISIECRVLAFW